MIKLYTLLKSIVIIVLSYIDNTMASNPFFSGRIPTELYQQAEKYCGDTGDSKTELLIKALSSYLNFPVTIPGKNFVAIQAEVSKEMFEELKERVKVLENSLKTNTFTVIKNDNNDNEQRNEQEGYDNVPKLADNKNNNLELQLNNRVVITTDNGTDNISDNEKQTFVIRSDNKVEDKNLEKESIVITIDNSTDNISDNEGEEFVIKSDNKDEDKNLKVKSEETQSSFKSILNSEVAAKINTTTRQVSRLAGRAVEKLKQQGKNVEQKQLLEEPIEVSQRGGINVNGYPYKLFYLGENLIEKTIWDLIPDDNANYQTVIKEANI